MRKQRGTGDLRALVYFDEIHGYLPPVANPPSKPLIIRLLKTARAFGVGLVLTTQNPVDVDYKALSNAGTWMVGRLQTDQDKQRLLDGLESAAGGVPRSEYDKLISSLGKRVFLYHNVNEKKPSIFHTRWAMSYLAGPLTITQIPQLNDLSGVRMDLSQSVNKPSRLTSTAREKGAASADRPKVSGVSEYFMPINKDEKTGVYAACLFAQAEVRYLKSNPVVDHVHAISAIVEDPREAGQAWEDYLSDDFDAGKLLRSPQSGMEFSALPEYLKNSSWISSQEKEFEHWIFETDTVTLRSSGKLGVAVGPEVSEEEFIALCRKAAEDKAESESVRLKSKYETKKTSLERKIASQELKVEKYRKEMASRGIDTALNVGGKVLDVLAGRKLRSISSSATKARMTTDARGRMKEAESVLESYQEELKNIDQAMEDEKMALVDKWMEEAYNITEVKLTPTKQNIRITNFGILWKP